MSGIEDFVGGGLDGQNGTGSDPFGQGGLMQETGETPGVPNYGSAKPGEAVYDDTGKPAGVMTPNGIDLFLTPDVDETGTTVGAWDDDGTYWFRFQFDGSLDDDGETPEGTDPDTPTGTDPDDGQPDDDGSDPDGDEPDDGDGPDSGGDDGDGPDGDGDDAPRMAPATVMTMAMAMAMVASPTPPTTRTTPR